MVVVVGGGFVMVVVVGGGCIVVVVVAPTTVFNTGAQRSTGLPTGTLVSCLNWSSRLTAVPLAKFASVAQTPLGHVFALIL